MGKRNCRKYISTGRIPFNIILWTVFIMVISCLGQTATGAAQIQKSLRVNKHTSHQYVLSKKLRLAKKRKVSLRLVGVPLLSALTQLSTKVQVGISYQKDVIPNKKVTLDLNNISVFNALKKILKGTNLEAVLPFSKDVLVIRKKQLKGTQILQETITGTVTDAGSGETLPGVNIRVKGTTTGTSTDADGNYSLTIESLQDTLVFSFVGYKSSEVPIDGRTTINISLQQQTLQGQEMVVVGYGTERKEDITGAISSVDAEDIAQRQTVQVSNALQGLVPGLTVTRNSGSPGAQSTLRLRGITTIGNNNPLIIVDGVPVDNIDNLNPNDIEDISVLKDAASASIYGSRAAAGVILVTTKRASQGDASINYNYEFGVQTPTQTPEYVDVTRYMELYNEFNVNDGSAPVYSKDLINNYSELHRRDPDEYPATDWQNILFDDYAPRQRHNLTFTVGNKNLKSKASFGYSTTNGLYDKRSYNKYTIRTNNDFKINNWISGHVDGHFKRTNNDGVLVNPYYEARLLPAIYDDRYEDGRLAPGKGGRNPLADVQEGGFNSSYFNRIGGRFALEVDPITNLSIEAIFAPTYDFNRSKTFSKSIDFTAKDNPSRVIYQNHPYTSLNELRPERFKYNGQLLIKYRKHFRNHNFKLLAGYEQNYAKYDVLRAYRKDFAITSFPYLNLGSLQFRDNGGSANENTLNSYFGRIKYNYENKYYIQGNIRADGSSRFAPDYRWGYFPSISVGWTLTEEKFMQNIYPISSLKIRGSWGKLGNERIGNYPYQASLTLEDVLFYQGNQIISEKGAAQRNLAINNITWEKTRTTDIGLDLRTFNDRLSLSADYFRKKTRDVLLTLDVPDFIGFGDPRQNAGIVGANGWETNLKWTDQIGKFSYSIGFNISDTKTKIIDLKGTQFRGDKAKIEGGEFNEWFGFRSDGLYQNQEGISQNPTLNSNVSPGDVKFLDVNGDGEINPDGDKVLLGGSLPRYTFGGNIRLGYKGLSFSMIFQGVGKELDRLNSIQVEPFLENFGKVPSIIDGNYWSKNNTKQENLEVRYPRFSRQSTSNNYTMSDFWLIDGSYLRIKNMTLTYSLPQKSISSLKLKGLKIYAAANDPFSFDHYPQGLDPEAGSSTYPIVKIYTVGVNLNF